MTFHAEDDSPEVPPTSGRSPRDPGQPCRRRVYLALIAFFVVTAVGWLIAGGTPIVAVPALLFAVCAFDLVRRGTP